MDLREIKKILKICRDNGIKEFSSEGLRFVFNESLTANKFSPESKKPRGAKSLHTNDVDTAKSKPQARSQEIIDDLIISDPSAWEELQLLGGQHAN